MTIADNLATTRHRIATAANRAGRSADEVRLVAVSKTRPSSAIREAVAAGQQVFGENRVQELVAKRADLGAEVNLVLIGHLQANKVSAAVRAMDEFQALDSIDLAARLDRRLLAAGRSLPVLIEVNTSGEASKFGVPLAEVVGFARSLTPFSCLQVRGLMTVAVHSDDQAAVASCFDSLAVLAARLREDAVLGSSWSELSMGMSSDFELAIEHGATTVRVGTAIFGARD